MALRLRSIWITDYNVHSVLFNLGENLVDADQKTHGREYGN